MTNRKELLRIAAQQADANQCALAWAGKVVSPESLQRLTARLERSDLRFGRAFTGVAGLMTLGVVGIVLALFGATVWSVLAVFVSSIEGIQDVASMVDLIMGGFVLMALGLCVVCGLADAGAKCTAELEWLKPIAGTDACVSALQYVESGFPSVLAWRDLALAERECLCAFDVEVLRCLRGIAESAASKQGGQVLNEEACRKLHGLAPVSGALSGGTV